jgi:hypothetical protein
MMLTSVGTAILTGVALGLRFNVLILVPAIGLADPCSGDRSGLIRHRSRRDCAW